MINIEDFDLNLLKADKKSYKNIDTIRSISGYDSINSENPLYFIVGEVDG